LTLRAIGLADDSERIYEILVDRGPSPTRDLAEASGLRTGHVRQVLIELQSLGLVRPEGVSGGRVRRFAATNPSNSITALILEREEALKRATMRAEDLAVRFHRMEATRDPPEMVEIVTGGDQIAQRLHQIERSARTQLRGLDRPPYHVGPATDPGERDFLSRGGIVRAIYAREALEIPDKLADIEDITRCGEQARVLGHVPIKLVLADDDVAIMPLRAGPGLSPSFVVVHRSALLEALSELFEMLWGLATPISLTTSQHDARPVHVTDQRRLLSLLVAGLSDEAIARELGVSVRTLHRRISILLERAHAVSRFQLGVQAQRLGWLD
jgi:DNA-binding Lrp family transcriptional regulator